MTQILPIAATYYNVKQYGAKGDNSTDDTSAIQAAITAANSAGGGTVFFPAGTYLISSTISLAPLCRYQGAHYYSSTIKQKNGANMTSPMLASAGYVNNNTTTDNPVQIENLGVNGNVANNGSSTSTGILLMSWLSTIRSCYVQNTPGDGIQIIDKNSAGTAITNTQVENRILDCKILNAGAHGIHATDYTSGTTHANTDGFIHNCIIDNPALNGIYLERSAGWLVDNNHLYTVGGKAIAGANAFGTRVAENYIEAGFGLTANANGTAFQAGIELSVIAGYGAIIENNLVVMTTDPANGNTFYYIRALANASASVAYCKVHGNLINGLNNSNHIGLRSQNVAGTLDLAEGMNTVVGFSAANTYSLVSPTLLDQNFHGDVVPSVHVRSSGSAPTIAAGANNGTSPPTPTISTNSNDLSGQLNFGTGTTPGSGAQTVVTFNTAFSVAPHVTLTPVNSASAVNFYVTSTTGGFTVNFVSAPTGGQGATTFAYFYHVLV